MTVTSTTTPQDEIHQAGLEVLHRELGPQGAERFVRQLGTGSGNHPPEGAQPPAGKAAKAHQGAPSSLIRQPVAQDLSEDEIREAGLDALRRGLGPRRLVLFLQQFSKGSGDFTAERHTLLGNPSVAQIVASIERRKLEAARAGRPGD